MKTILFVLLISVVAQVFPSCGEGEAVIGWIDEKIVLNQGGERIYVIAINRVEYSVPWTFWSQVRIGDLVKFDGTQWLIVRKAGS